MSDRYPLGHLVSVLQGCWLQRRFTSSRGLRYAPETMPQTTSAGKETRLLVVTIVVSIVLLLVLARFRFPARPSPAAEPPAQALERLAARATYDELTSILRGVDAHVSGSVLAVGIVAQDEAAPDEPARPASTAAVRIASDRAIALTRAGRHIDAINATGITLIASDERRGVSLLGTAAGAGSVPDVLDSTETIEAPGYLAAIEATPAGLAVRPMYFGRVDRANDPAWSDPVLRFSALQQALPEGAAIFTLRGEFVGLGIPDGRDLIVVPSAMLQHAADTLTASGSQSLADVGFDVQPLSAALRDATGATDGVVVTYVAPDGAAANALRIGDVVTGIGDVIVHAPDDFRAATLAASAGQPMPIRFVRSGAAGTAQITPTPARRSAPAIDHGQLGLGLTLRTAADGGSEVMGVAPGSAAARAGLMEGDVITMLDGAPHPRPADIRRAFERLPSGRWLLVAMDRDGRHLVTAVGKP